MAIEIFHSQSAILLRESYEDTVELTMRTSQRNASCMRENHRLISPTFYFVRQRSESAINFFRISTIQSYHSCLCSPFFSIHCDSPFSSNPLSLIYLPVTHSSFAFAFLPRASSSFAFPSLWNVHAASSKEPTSISYLCYKSPNICVFLRLFSFPLGSKRTVGYPGNEII